MASATALSYSFPSAASSPPATNTVRRLLIEDEPETARYIVNGLKSAGILQAVLRRSPARDDAPLLEMADLVLDLRSRKATRGDFAIALQPWESLQFHHRVEQRLSAIRATGSAGRARQADRTFPKLKLTAA